MPQIVKQFNILEDVYKKAKFYKLITNDLRAINKEPLNDTEIRQRYVARFNECSFTILKALVYQLPKETIIEAIDAYVKEDLPIESGVYIDKLIDTFRKEGFTDLFSNDA